MGGYFGVVSKDDCVSDLFYGTDYHSHLGTRRGGLAVHDGAGCTRFIHDITNAQFRSKLELDLAGRRAIKEMEGQDGPPPAEYADPASEKYQAMVERIRHRLGLTTLRYQQLGDLVASIGLAKEQLCTYCWDGTE